MSRSLATLASDRTLAPADDRFHAAQQARCLTRPPETLANLLGSALRLSSRANVAVTLFGHWLAEPPMGSDPGLTPSSAIEHVRKRVGTGRYAPPRRGRVQFRGIKTPPPGVSPRGGRSDSYPDGLSTTPVLCRDQSLWTKIKTVEAAATKAIAEATPVLNGDRLDEGQLIAALMALENVKQAITEAQTKLKGETP